MRFLPQIAAVLCAPLYFVPLAVSAETRSETFKTVGTVKLDVNIHFPDGWKATDQRPAILLFFGGGWKSGTPRQFENHARYLASRGMIAMTPDYRVETRHGVKAADCVADAKSAVRWARANAARLGIDPQRIAAGGGSAGGHLAAAAATLPGLDDPADDRKVSCIPDALVLFNPALLLAPMEGVELRGFERGVTAARVGCEPEAISPAHHVRPGAPATIIFHGTLDDTVPYSTAELFRDRMVKAGNRCELVGAEGQAHGFFNFGRNNDSHAFATLTAADRFLASLGWLTGEPSVIPYFTAHPPTKASRR